MLGTAADFFAKAKVKTEDVEVPGVGTFRVRGLTVAEYTEWSKASTRYDSKGKATFEADLAKLVQLGTVGEDGKRLFSLADIARLRESGKSFVAPLAKAISRLNGEQEDDLGNSPETTESGSSSA